jgi:hypothetical protein
MGNRPAHARTRGSTPGVHIRSGSLLEHLRTRLALAFFLLSALVPVVLVTTGALDNQGPRLSAATVTDYADIGPQTGISPGNWTTSAISGSQLTSEANAVGASGAAWVRLGAFWGQSEWHQGQFTWANSDAVIGAADASGIPNVEFVIDTYAPPWALTSDGSPDPQAYASFAAAAVRRYSPQGVHVYEIGNEDNLGSNWNQSNGDANPQEYAALLRAAYSAIKAADPNAWVLLGGISPAPDNEPISYSPQSWLTDIYADGGKGSFDAVNVHPYDWPAAPMDGSTSSWNYFYNIPNWIYSVMQQNGDGNMKIWGTEFGYPTAPNPSYSNAVSDALQATYIGVAYLQWSQWSFAGPLFVYNWEDGNDGSWDTYGLVDSNGNAKPALSVFAQWSQILNSRPSGTTSPAQTTTTTTPPTTTTTVPTATPSPSGSSTAPGTGASPIGAVVSGWANQTSQTTLSVSPAQGGDALVLGVSAQAPVSSVTGGDAAWQRIAQFDDATAGWDYELWLGQTVSTDTSQVTVSLSGQSSDIEVGMQEFSAGAPAWWSVGSTSSLHNDTGTTFSYPQLSAPQPSLYVGMANGNYAGTAMTTGNTPGVTYHTFPDAWNDQFVYSVGVTNAQPNGTLTVARPVSTIAAMLSSSPIVPPASASAPSISGTASTGQVLSASTGNWTNGPTSLGFQWLRCDSLTCTVEDGATGATYMPVRRDVGFQIEVVVTGSNLGGQSSATSPATSQVAQS